MANYDSCELKFKNKEVYNYFIEKYIRMDKNKYIFNQDLSIMENNIYLNQKNSCITFNIQNGTCDELDEILNKTTKKYPKHSIKMRICFEYEHFMKIHSFKFKNGTNKLINIKPNFSFNNIEKMQKKLGKNIVKEIQIKAVKMFSKFYNFDGEKLNCELIEGYNQDDIETSRAMITFDIKKYKVRATLVELFNSIDFEIYEKVEEKITNLKKLCFDDKDEDEGELPF